MKILIICPDWFPNISGFGIACHEFAKRASKEHKVTILTPTQKNLDKKGLDVQSVPQLLNLMGRNPLVVGLLRRIQKIDYDVILLYSYMFEMNARVAIWRKMGIIKKPVILMYRGSLEDDVLKQLSLPLRAAKIVYDKTYGAAVFKCSDYIISNSKPTLDVMTKKYGIQKNKMMYIPNSVNINEYKQSKLNNKRVLFCGRLIENKGVKLFDKIIKGIPRSWKFTVVGDGPMEHVILGLKRKRVNLEYLGKLSKEKTNEIYSKSDILALPTFAEGSPRVVLEASAAGVPSVAFDVGDVSTVLDKNKNGYVIPRYDLDKFIAAVRELIEDEKLRTKKGASARAYALKNLNWNHNYSLLIRAIRDVCKTKT